MRILLLGAYGMLGRAVEKVLGPEFEIISRDWEDYDIRDTKEFERDLAETLARAVINCAAYTMVDQAETEADLAMEINGKAPGELSRACQAKGVTFVQLSTDYVFDGKSDRPYKEDDRPAPLSAYGKSKQEGERAAAAANPDGYLIVRTSGMFGSGGVNFVKTVIGRYRTGRRSFKVVSDQRFSPTYAADLAGALGACLAKGLTGIYHACNRGETTWYGFAREIFETAGISRHLSIEPVTAREYGAAASRPAFSVLDTGRLEREAGVVMPDYLDGLSRYLFEDGGAVEIEREFPLGE